MATVARAAAGFFSGLVGGRRWLLAGLTMALGMAVVGGCSGKTEPGRPAAATPANAPATQSRGTIGVSLLTLDNPFFKVIGDAIAATGSAQGYQTLVVSAEKDVARQGNQVKDFIVRKVSAIVLSPCDSKAIGPVIAEANAAGIPVFTVDIPYRGTDAKVVTQVATDNFGGGREAARAMIEALGSSGGKVAILHFKQAESCLLRVNGFREAITAHNNALPSGPNEAKLIEIVAELESNAARDTGYKAAEDVLQAHPDLRGIFAINDPAALGACGAIEKAGKAGQIVVVGFDGQPEGKQAIREGKIYADPVQFPEKMGEQVVDAIIRHSRGEELPAETLIPTSLYRKADAEQELQTAR
jgi:ribose transport system substrate-binding protein